MAKPYTRGLMTNLRTLATSALVTTLLGCGNAEEPHERPRPSAPVVTPQVEAPLVRTDRSLMSTEYQVSVVSEDQEGAHAAAERALDEIARLEDVLSEWRDTSRVSAINAAAGDHPVVVDDDTWAIMQSAQETSIRTGGAYDLSWAALRGLYLFQRDNNRVPTDAEIAARLPLVNYRDIVLDAAAQSVFLRRAGMAIGTGGIAKGYALDRATEILVESGFPNFMIFGGGQIQVHGLRGDRSWRVGIQHPRRSDYIAFLDVTDCSIATSGDYEHYFIDDEGRRWHHIIDLRTGRPAEGTMQVTVITESGLDADAIDTGCFIMGAERCLELFRQMPGYDAVIIDSDLRVHMTEGARARLTWRTPLVDGRISL